MGWPKGVPRNGNADIRSAGWYALCRKDHVTVGPMPERAKATEILRLWQGLNNCKGPHELLHVDAEHEAEVVRWHVDVTQNVAHTEASPL